MDPFLSYAFYEYIRVYDRRIFYTIHIDIMEVDSASNIYQLQIYNCKLQNLFFNVIFL